MNLTCVFVQYHEDWTKFYFDTPAGVKVSLYLPRERGALASKRYVVGKICIFVLPE